MATAQPAGQQRNAFGRDHGNYATVAAMPNGSGNVLPSATVPFNLEAGDRCYLTASGVEYLCLDRGTAGGGDAIWVYAQGMRLVVVAAAGSRDITIADDGAILLFTAVAGATAVVKSTLPVRFSCWIVRATGAGPVVIDDDGGATTFELPASATFLPTVAEAGATVGVDMIAVETALLTQELGRQAPSISIAAAGPLIGDDIVATTGGVVDRLQWYRASLFGGVAGATRAPIVGAASATYVRQAADVGYDITCDAIGPGGTTTSNIVAGATTAAAALGSTPTLDLPDTGLTGNPLTAAVNTGSAGGSWTGAGLPTSPLRGSMGGRAVQQSIGSFMTSPTADSGYFSTDALELVFVAQVGQQALVDVDVAANAWQTARAMISDFDLAAPRIGVSVSRSGCFVGIFNGVALVSTITTGFAPIKCDQPTVVHARLFTDAGGTLGIKVGSGAEVTLVGVGAIDALNNHLASFANWGATLNLTGKIGEPVGHNASWTAAQRATIQAWLGNKYGAEY